MMKCSKCGIEIEKKDCMYCSSCFRRLDKNRLKKSSSIVALIVFFIGISLIIHALHYEEIDENKFCLDKLNRNFPEYEFDKAEYSHKTKDLYSCIGSYSTGSKIRDGLEEVKESETIEFKLINQADIDYLNSDNNREKFLLLGGGLIIFLIFILFTVYME